MVQIGDRYGLLYLCHTGPPFRGCKVLLFLRRDFFERSHHSLDILHEVAAEPEPYW